MRLLIFLLVFAWAGLAFCQEDVEPEFDEVPLQGPSQEGDLNTIKQNNTEDSFNKTYNGAGSSGMPVSSAIAPTLMSSGQESCLQSSSSGIQGFTLGYSRGSYKQDPECNRRRNAITLSNMGMKVAAVSLMCQDPQVFLAMLTASTPCPITRHGKIVVGRRVYLLVKQDPALYIAGYNDNRDYYDSILGVGIEDTNEEQATGSISDRFRSSTRTDGD